MRISIKKVMLFGLMLFSLFFITYPKISAQQLQNNFTHFSQQDGLPSGIADPIIQDHLGYLWIGTNNGVSRYDGYEFLNFIPIPNDTNYLQLPLISSLFEDSSGDIWIGAVSGITRYNRTENTFDLFSLYEYEREEKSTFVVTEIVETLNGDLLFSVRDFHYSLIKNGLYVFDKKNGNIKIANISNQDSTNIIFDILSIENDKYLVAGFKGFGEYDLTNGKLNWKPFDEPIVATTLLQESNNKIWLGIVHQGLISYNLEENSYSKYNIYKGYKTANSFKFISDIMLDNDKNLLITSNNGLFHFNQETRDVIKTELNPINPSSLNTNNLSKILLDKSGSIWFTHDKGLSKYDFVKNNFISFTHNVNDKNSLTEGWANLVFEFDNDELWIHTGQNVINRFNTKSNKFSQLKLPDDFSVFDMINYSNGNLLISGYGGIYSYNKELNKFETFELNVNLNRNPVECLLEVNNTLWFGTYRGLHIYDKISKATTIVSFESLGIGTLASTQVHSLLKDRNNNIWIGTDDGLFNYDFDSRLYSRFGSSTDTNKSFITQDVNSLYEDKTGNIWVGTWLGGLHKLDPETGIIKKFAQDAGLKSHSVQGILGDEENGALWLSTFDGISRFDLQKKTFSNFGVNDGIQGNQFADGSALKTSSGKFVFGGQNGFTIFNSKVFETNLVPPEVVITDFKIFNESIQPGENSPLKKPIYNTNKIVLDYDENDISFDYIAMHFVDSKNNKYAYTLENYEDEWRYVGNQRTAIYPNLPAGNYIFRLKASNNNEIWSENEVSINIEIQSPWWSTVWAYGLYILLLAALLFGIRKFELNRQKKNAELKESHLRAESAELQAKAAEAQAQVMQVENERKSKELEEARQLQLSMLPKELPQLPHLDIAVYMKTATEVGGDYYDFHIGLDGTLTVVLGDATGHGMKAGTMVTTTKSLFNVLASNSSIIDTFHEMTRCLKLMHLDKLSMCMTMLKLSGNCLEMSSAGMPPVFIYKNETQIVEEHVMKGMPLGTFKNFPYTLLSSDLSAGDTILLMSDGFPELFNDKKEMYGYKRARNLFEELASEAPEDIISKLKTAGSEWVNNNDPDDDVTFVVIKIK